MTLSTEQPSKFKTLKFAALFCFFVLGSAILVLGGGYLFFSRNLPTIISMQDYKPLLISKVVVKEGKAERTLAEFYKERRAVIPVEKIPDKVKNAFISAEDDDFFNHQGISPSAILRASIANFKAGHVVQGGSTITQQVAKSLFLSLERSLGRKIREVILASRLEKTLTKEQILFLYLNQIYLGHGAYGIEAAADAYFHKSTEKLSLAEAALLAGLPRAPSAYNPLTNPKRAKERQLYVLKRMVETGAITDKDMSASASEPVKIYIRGELDQPVAPHLIENVRRYLIQTYGEKAVYEEGLRVVVPSTYERIIIAGEQLKKGLREVDKRQGYRGPIRVMPSDIEIAEFNEKSKNALLEKLIQAQSLLPDGNLEPVMPFSDPPSGAVLVKENELYEALVTRIADAEKRAYVTIAGEEYVLPMDRMKWAKRPVDQKVLLEESTLPSQVLGKGDVVFISLTKEFDKIQKKQTMIANLEQKPEVQGAVVAMDLRSGYLLAMEGGYEFNDSEFNRATQAKRQPGSAFKPIIFSFAIENGYTPASLIIDAPIVYDDAEQGKWRPENFDEKFHGDTTLHMAFAKSRNIPTIKLVQELGVQKLLDYSSRLKLNGAFNPDLSIALGTGSVSLFDLCQTYALFPRLGHAIKPISILKVIAADGRILEENKPVPLPGGVYTPPALEVMPGKSPPPTEGGAANNLFSLSSYPRDSDPEQVMDPRVAYMMTTLMKGVVEGGTGQLAKSLGRVSAGKTGTTNDFKDAWYIGFTPHFLVGVWIGYDDQKRSLGPGETGARAALPIWLEIMKQITKDEPVDVSFRAPSGVVIKKIDLNTGHLADKTSELTAEDAFIVGTEPSYRESVTKKTQGDSSSDFLKEDMQ